MLLRHALAQAFLHFAVGIGRGHVDAERFAGLVPFHRLLQARDDVAVADQDGERLASFDDSIAVSPASGRRAR
jgi:hypothetical protein